MGIFDFLNSQQTGTQNVTTSIDPQIKQAYLANLNFADTVASRPYQQYSGPRIAGLTADQQSAIDATRAMQGQGNQFFTGSANTVQDLMGFNAPQVGYNGANATGYDVERANLASLLPAVQQGAFGYDPTNVVRTNLGPAVQAGAAGINRGNVRNVSAGSFLSGDINAYQNPYQNAVIDQVQNDLGRQLTLDTQRLNADAARSGAFGGTRAEVAKQELGRNYGDQFARTVAQLRNQGFENAANLMQSDINRNMQAQQMNQGVDLNIAGQNAGFRQNTNLANQAARNQFALTQFANDAANNQFNAANQTAAAQYLAGARNTASANNAAAQNQINLTGFGAKNALNQFNAANQIGANSFLAGARNNFALNNQNQAFAAQQANQEAALQSAGIRSGAANQYANLGTARQAQNLIDINALMQAGLLQQNQTQRNLDLANQDFQNQFNYPVQQLAIRQGALGANIPMLGQTQSTPIYENRAGQVLGALQGVNSLLGNGQSGTGSFLSGIGTGIGRGIAGLLPNSMSSLAGSINGFLAPNYFTGGMSSADYVGGYDV